jgi:transcriptional regulator of acetoin/glycerol metabolism
MKKNSQEHSNSSYSYLLGGNQNDVLSRERWESVRAFRESFFHQQQDPYLCPYMSKDVADSWIRSKAFGLDPETRIINLRVDIENDKEFLEENRLLIESTKIIYEALKLKDLLFASSYGLYLFDKNNILLMHAGEDLVIDNSLIGTVWSEETVGTCAHTLALLLKRPFHLMGPEHYCYQMDTSNSSSAPVLDEEGEVIGTLTLSQHLPEHPTDDDCLGLSSHTMGLITAMAAAVENRMKLKKSYEEIKAAHLRQKVTLAFIDEGIITIYKSGKIAHANKEATRILQCQAEDIENRNIREFLNPQSQ